MIQGDIVSEEQKEIIKLLKEMNENIETLTKVTALSLRKDSVFKDKVTKQEQIEALDDLELSDKLIALAIGSTPGSVKAARSSRKAKINKATAPVAVEKPSVGEAK